jgi:hypothetical protein
MVHYIQVQHFFKTFLSRLPPAYVLFLDEKNQKSRAAEKKAKNISSCVK